MKRTYPQTIREVLDDVMRQGEMHTRMQRLRACRLWPEVVGPGIARLCGEPTMSTSLMNVPVRTAALRQELSMVRSRIKDEINARLGSEVVTDIRFISLQNH